jgi:hypothetical protein
MIIEHQGRNKCCCPKIKSIEEKGLKLLQHPLVVLKIFIIHFSPKAYKRQGGTIFYITTLRVLLAVYQQASKLTTWLGITQDKPKGLKKTFHLTMEKKMVNGLHIPLIHATPVNHNDMPLPKIVHVKDIS